jgi:hypothetical protein
VELCNKHSGLAQLLRLFALSGSGGVLGKL